MSLYLLLNRIQVQNANAVAGFTWGFPAITHFLGFTHNLSRKLSRSAYHDLDLKGCSVIAHQHHVHTYGKYNDRFLQSKNPAYLTSDVDKVAKGRAPSIVEEGKMNMTVSLLIPVQGSPGRRVEEWLQWLKPQCVRQRLAGGTILSIQEVALFDMDNQQDLYRLKRQLLPGFTLIDRSTALADHYLACQKNNADAELIDAWLDFSLLKQQARPKAHLITAHLKRLASTGNDTEGLNDIWLEHLNSAYSGHIPDPLNTYFTSLATNKENKSLLQQWAQYLEPDAKTPADWEFLKKPESGYLVPIMTGYKAISSVYNNHEVANTRDHETPVCFVESVHSVAEWRGVHRLRNAADIAGSVWYYQYEDGWYLCKQQTKPTVASVSHLDTEVQSIFNPEDELA